MKSLSKAFVFFAVSKHIPVIYSADRGRTKAKPSVSQTLECVLPMYEPRLDIRYYVKWRD